MVLLVKRSQFGLLKAKLSWFPGQLGNINPPLLMTAQSAWTAGFYCCLVLLNVCILVFSCRIWLTEATTEQREMQRTQIRYFTLVWGLINSISQISHCLGSVHPLLMTLLPAITDLDDNHSAFGLDCPPLKLDHCDLLLDAIDAQLGKLQVSDFHSVYLWYFMPLPSTTLHFTSKNCTLYSTR